MTTLQKQKPAFTMLELVMVIVVLGILAALAMPRMDRDLRQEAADNVLSAIRYTQHLALVDDKTNPFNPNWQKKLWSIHFTAANSGSYYNVSSDIDEDGSVDKNETAIDPANGDYMYHHHNNPIQGNESPNVLIGNKYGVTSIQGSGGCNNIKHIGFDHIGRPHVSFGASTVPDYSSHMPQDCIFIFTLSDGGTFDINISKETGYAFIVGQDNS